MGKQKFDKRMDKLKFSQITIKVLSDEQIRAGQVIQEDSTTIPLKIKTVGLLETATAQGKMGVTFVLEDKHGNEYAGHMTQNIFDGVCNAFNGARQRFNK